MKFAWENLQDDRTLVDSPNKGKIMAYIIGLLTPEEEAELIRRGWEVEAAPQVDFDSGKPCSFPSRMKMVWVDQDMFKIMDGPDWDRGESQKDVAVTKR